MVGLGKWKFNVDTMFYRGDAFLSIGEKDGEYDIGLELPGMDVPDFSVNDIQAEGNTVTGNVKTSLLRGKEIPFSYTFEGESASGFMKVPFMGKIKLNNGVKVG